MCFAVASPKNEIDVRRLMSSNKSDKKWTNKSRNEIHELQNVKYYTKTKLGIATRPNGHMKPDPFLGSGQGATDSPARWAFIG